MNLGSIFWPQWSLIEMFHTNVHETEYEVSGTFYKYD